MKQDWGGRTDGERQRREYSSGVERRVEGKEEKAGLKEENGKMKVAVKQRFGRGEVECQDERGGIVGTVVGWEQEQ